MEPQSAHSPPQPLSTCSRCLSTASGASACVYLQTCSLVLSTALSCTPPLASLGCLSACLCPVRLLTGHNWAQNSTSPCHFLQPSCGLRTERDGELVFGKRAKDVKDSQRSAGYAESRIRLQVPVSRGSRAGACFLLLGYPHPLPRPSSGPGRCLGQSFCSPANPWTYRLAC